MFIMFTTEGILKWYYKEKERNKYQKVRMIVIFGGEEHSALTLTVFLLEPQWWLHEIYFIITHWFVHFCFTLF